VNSFDENKVKKLK